MPVVRRAWILLLSALVVLLVGCSLVAITYNNAAFFAVWGVDSYFSLSSAQSSDLRARLDRQFAWHRAEQMPEYASFLVKLQARLQGSIDAADMAWLYAESRKRYLVVVDTVAPDAAALALTLRPEQIDRLEQRFARTDQEYADSDVNVPLTQARERSVRDTLKGVEKWLGSLDESQKNLLRARAAELPFEPRLSHEEYVRRHREMIALLRAGISGQAESRRLLEAGLRRLLGRWQEGQSAAHAEFIGRQTAAYQRFFAEAAMLSTPTQREHTIGRLRYYIDEISALSALSVTRPPPSRPAAGAS